MSVRFDLVLSASFSRSLFQVVSDPASLAPSNSELRPGQTHSVLNLATFTTERGRHNTFVVAGIVSYVQGYLCL